MNHDKYETRLDDMEHSVSPAMVGSTNPGVISNLYRGLNDEPNIEQDLVNEIERLLDALEGAAAHNAGKPASR